MFDGRIPERVPVIFGRNFKKRCSLTPQAPRSRFVVSVGWSLTMIAKSVGVSPMSVARALR